MEDRLDAVNEANLLKALEKMKSFAKHMEEKRENQLWRTVELPCSLTHVFDRLTKDDLDQIGKTYGSKNLSALKKADLVAELARSIPLMIKRFIYSLDRGRYDIIKAIAKNKGVIPDRGISLPNAESFLRYSMVFPGKFNDQRVLFLPDEILDIFRETDDDKLQNIIDRNTEWICLAQGLLYYYGFMEIELIIKKINELTGHKPDQQEFRDVMSFASDFYGQVRCTTHGYKDKRVYDAMKIAEEHQRLADIEYFPFTEDELFEAGVPDYVNRTPAMESFIEFLKRHYALSAQMTDEIAKQMINLINTDSDLSIMVQYLQSFTGPEPLKDMQLLIVKITELYNNTRQWALKGHTPFELVQAGKKYPKQLPGLDEMIAESLPARIKTGRNEPCPCGSGIKYKKCCGK